MGTISFGGKIKDNKETLDAEKPNPLKPLTKEANSITLQKNIKSFNDLSFLALFLSNAVSKELSTYNI